MAFVYVSLGSNVGDKKQYLIDALCAMKERNFWLKVGSKVYHTEPKGSAEQDWFLNMCLLIDTRYPPLTLLKKCQEIEDFFGRDRSQEKWGPRTLDIDIIFYEDMIFEDPRLIIPHPFMHERKFVLAPLDEIAPLFEHPVLKKTVHRLLMECPDASIVEPFSSISLP